ncbi:hypothetical protein NMY22_g14334 [Coprinellus aureogranulatus]|nr:hypothetical protein NMY22_g14334 [Coprinellus aureogranulatus]
MRKSLDEKENTRPSDIVILIMGCTRAGKSTFINLLLQHIGDGRPELKVEPDVLSTVTSELEQVVITGQIERQNLHFVHLRKDQRLVFVDTPGLPDRDQLAALTGISSWLREALKKSIFGGIIYIHDISADRDTGENARRNLVMLRGLCPEATLDKVTLITSKWSVLGEGQAAKREAELKEGQWKSLLDATHDTHLMRLSPDSEAAGPKTAWQIVRHTLWRLDIWLGRQSLAETQRLRDELAKTGKPVPDEAQALEEALRESVELQQEVFALLKSAANGNKEAEGVIKSKEERLKTLHQLVILNKSLFYASFVPNLTHKWIAFNSVVVG